MDSNLAEDAAALSPEADKHSERQKADWDVSNAPKNYAALVIAQVATAAFSFASVWLLTHYVGAEGYGGVTAILLGAQLAQIPVMWTGNALSRYGVEEFVATGKLSRIFWARTSILVPNLAIMGLLAPVWLPLLGGWLKVPSELYPLLVLNFLVSALSMHAQYSLHGAKLMRLQSVLTLTERVLIFLSLIVLALSGQLSISYAIWAYSIPTFIVAVISLWNLRPVLTGFVFDPAVVKKIIVFSLPIPLFSIVSHLTFNHLDAIFILRYMTQADLGIYSVAYQLNTWVIQLSYFAGFVAMPMLVTSQANDQGQLRTAYFRDILPLFTFCFGLLAVAVAFVGYFAFPYLLDENFGQVGPLLFIFAASCALTVPIQAGFQPLGYSMSVTYMQLIAAAVGATANVILNVMLIPHYGLVGCVWATIASSALNLLVFAALSKFKFDVPVVSAMIAPLPAVAGAAVFTWSGNIVISTLTVLVSAIILFLVRWNSFVNGFRKLLARFPR